LKKYIFREKFLTKRKKRNTPSFDCPKGVIMKEAERIVNDEMFKIEQEEKMKSSSLEDKEERRRLARNLKEERLIWRERERLKSR
jgi:hypothetical protein